MEIIGPSGKPYLRLLTPDASPTAAQHHALKVLTHTFVLLSGGPIATFDSSNNNQPQSQYVPQMPQVFGLNNNANNNRQQAGVQARVRPIPVRALLTPLILLCLRTMFLLYFFSPTRKPLFGVLLGAWVIYEAWGAIRGAFGNVNEPGDAREMNREQAHPRPQNDDLQERLNRLRRDLGMPANRNAPASEIVMNRLAEINLNRELRYIGSAEGVPGSEEPSFLERTRMFITLFFLTLHPAIWNRRRAALRAREGRLRTEAHARRARENENEEQVPEAIRAARAQLIGVLDARPRWVRNYVERIQREEFPED